MISSEALEGVPLLVLANKQDVEVHAHIKCFVFFLFFLNRGFLCKDAPLQVLVTRWGSVFNLKPPNTVEDFDCFL